MPQSELKIRFEIAGDHIELLKLLKVTGLCPSGGAAKTVTAGGQVTVDGQVELRRRCKIRRGQVVVFAGQAIEVV
jgi:ribosome-associated protein